jgi:hypothetical protein
VFGKCWVPAQKTRSKRTSKKGLGFRVCGQVADNDAARNSFNLRCNRSHQLFAISNCNHDTLTDRQCVGPTESVVGNPRRRRLFLLLLARRHGCPQEARIAQIALANDGELHVNGEADADSAEELRCLAMARESAAKGSKYKAPFPHFIFVTFCASTAS